MAGLCRRRAWRQKVDLEKRCESTQDTSQCSGGTCHSSTGGNSERVSSFHGESDNRGDVSLVQWGTDGLEQAGPKNHPSSGGSFAAGLVWLAWIQTQHCVELV